MTRKILRNAYLVAVSVLLSCAVLFFAVMYRSYEDQTLERLQAEADAISSGLTTQGALYLKELELNDRVTWVGHSGKVLFDSVAEPDDLASHVSREEIEEAFFLGTGVASRYSQTLLTKTYYYAERLANGTVLRVSCTKNSVLSMLVRLLPAFLAVAVIVLMLCGFLSYRLAQQITKPINAIDPDDEEPAAAYEELAPLTNKLREQKKTIHRQMSELLLRQREFTAITENMREGFLLLDGKKQILSSNHSALALLTPGAQQAPTQLDANISMPELLSAVDTALAGSHAELLLTLEQTTWQVLVNPVVANAQVAGAVVLFMDVTEREQREALRREFSANVSHELKTPLTSISGFAELMKEGLVPPEKIPEFSGDIYRETRRLIGLVDDIIQLSRLDENAAALPREPVDLYALGEHVLETLQHVAERHQISLHLDGQRAVISGAEQLLTEMIYNLVDNAIKYNHPGGSVTLRVTKEGPHTVLSVSDTGIGIPYADQPRVFERFYRVDKSHSKEVGGTGLGLSIVKHAAQFHKARLQLQSQPGRGTCIRVIF